MSSNQFNDLQTIIEEIWKFLIMYIIKKSTLMKFHAAIANHFQKQLYQSSPNKESWSTYILKLWGIVPNGGTLSNLVPSLALQTCVSNCSLSISSGIRSNWHTKLSMFKVKLLRPLVKNDSIPRLPYPKSDSNLWFA